MSEPYLKIDPQDNKQVLLAIDTSVSHIGKLTARLHMAAFFLMEAKAALVTRYGAPMTADAERAYAEARNQLESIPSLLNGILKHLNDP